MNYKRILLLTIINASLFYSLNMKAMHLGEGAAKELAHGMEEAAKESTTASKNFGENFGRNAGMGTLEAIIGYLVQASALAKTGLIIGVPYALLGAAATAVCYGLYRLFLYLVPQARPFSPIATETSLDVNGTILNLTEKMDKQICIEEPSATIIIKPKTI